MRDVARRAARAGQKLLRRVGYEVRPYPPAAAGAAAPAAPSPPDVWSWIRDSQGIRTVIDIGANNGDFAAFLSRYLGAERTIAFEPLPSCRALLEAKAGDIRGLVVHPVALSDVEGEETFYENSYGPSSSLLHVGEIHKAEFPHTRGETATRVRVARLDDLVDPAGLPRNLMVKMDVQGMELRALAGGQRVFRAAQCVLVEMSFEEMYEGQPLFEEVHAALLALGLRFAGIKNQIASTRTGQPLFAHCFYVRRP